MVCARMRKIMLKVLRKQVCKNPAGARPAQARRKRPNFSAQGGHYYDENFEQRSYIYVYSIHSGLQFRLLVVHSLVLVFFFPKCAILETISNATALNNSSMG